MALTDPSTSLEQRILQPRGFRSWRSRQDPLAANCLVGGSQPGDLVDFTPVLNNDEQWSIYVFFVVFCRETKQFCQYCQPTCRPCQNLSMKFGFSCGQDFFLDNSRLIVFAPVVLSATRFRRDGSENEHYSILAAESFDPYYFLDRWHCYLSNELDDISSMPLLLHILQGVQIKKCKTSWLFIGSCEACWWFPLWLEAPCLKFFQNVWVRCIQNAVASMNVTHLNAYYGHLSCIQGRFTDFLKWFMRDIRASQHPVGNWSKLQFFFWPRKAPDSLPFGACGAPCCLRRALCGRGHRDVFLLCRCVAHDIHSFQERIDILYLKILKTLDATWRSSLRTWRGVLAISFTAFASNSRVAWLVATHVTSEP